MMSLLSFLPMILLFDDPVATEAPDLSSPRAATRAYFTALDTGNVKQLETACRANKVQKEWLAAQVDTVQSLKRFGDVGAKHFGDAGKVLQQPSAAKLALDRFEKIEIEADGDRAIAKVNPKVPLQLSRGDDGLWRVDFERTLAGKDAEMAFATKVFTETAKLVNGLADETAAGKFATVGELQQALRERRKALDVKLVREKPASLP